MAGAGKFNLPSIDELDEGIPNKRIRKLFQAHRNLLSDNSEANEKSGELPQETRATTTRQTEEVLSRSDKAQTAKQNSVSAGSLPRHAASCDTLETAPGGSKQTVGRTFQETFAFLKDSDHYKEEAERIQAANTKAKESSKQSEDRVSTVAKPKPNAIIVNPRQKGNPILKHVRNVPWEFGDIVPDYVLGQTTCALFLSMRYHNFNPDYIHERLRQLGSCFELRILLVQVDVKDPHQNLKEFNKMCIMANCTLILAWSAEEAGRYLETYKVYENKPPDVLQGRSDGDYMTKLSDCLTTIKGVNKTDVNTLISAFGSLEKIGEASKEDLAYLPGFGSKKAERLYHVFHEPFVVGKKRKDEG